jgi:deoxyribodipyrimidine photolyase-related protein
MTIRLILGDQLNEQHSWFTDVRPDVCYVMMEVRSETDYVVHHAQKVIAIFAAMRAFASMLRSRGHRVLYHAIDDEANPQSFEAAIADFISRESASRFEWQLPDEWRLDVKLRRIAEACGVDHGCVDTEHFYASRDEAARVFAAKKQWRLETFYRVMRVKHGVMLEADGTPVGGEWNYDTENRSAWKGKPIVPADERPVHDHTAIWVAIQRSGVRTVGDPNASALRWPVDRTEALAQLQHVVNNVLPTFGPYQDAMSERSDILFHTLLSFALNVKMLSPAEVVNAAERAYRDGRVPLASAEGFIRQILGWREYVRGVYWANMPGYTERNALGQHRPLPEWYWTANTKMRCVSSAVRATLDNAYAHHIQRLMITGNIALLLGIDPHDVHRWYLGVYIDAFEWVEAPNTIGMSQYADGGIMASKPYISGAAYINRMSDHCKHCYYRPDQRTGDTACPFTALYWDFMATHRETLSRNVRMRMVYASYDKFPSDERDAIRRRAEWLRDNVDAI